MSNKKITVTSPIDNSVLGEVELATVEEVKEMVRKAKEAQPAWEAVPLVKRAEITRRLADLLVENELEIGTMNTKEMGKPLAQSITECEDAATLLRGHTERALHLYGQVLGQNIEEPELIFTRREALGVIGVIVPYNYPIELTYQKLAPALICGNTCVVKVPRSNPLTILAMDKYIKEAGVPENVVQIYCSDGKTTEEAITKNADVAAVAMTGSTAAGKQIMKAAGDTLKPLMLELGGNDPFIVFDDVDPRQAAEEIAAGREDCCGQICCGTKRVIIHESIKDAVIKELIDVLGGWKVGNPLEDGVIVGTLVSEDAAKEVEAQVQHTIDQGATKVWGNGRSGAVWEPVILDNVTKDMDVAQNMEIFAAVFPFITFKTEEEAIEIANNTDYGLSSGVLSGDTMRALRVAGKIQAGAVIANGHGCYRIYEQAFGGYKHSGVGREGISVGIEEFSQVKTIYLKGAFAEK